MRIKALRRTTLACFVLCCVGGTLARETPSANGVEATDFIGALRLATDEEGVELLRLDEETRKKLAELAATRNQQGQLLLANPRLSNADKQRLLTNFVAESEQLGQQLLSLDQREALTRLLLAREGMVTLAREDVSRILALTESQRSEIARVLEARLRAVDRQPGLRREIAIRDYERRLQALLTPTQLSKWQSMAALGSPAAGEEPTGGGPALTAAGNRDGGERQTPASPSQVRLRFTFERMPWRSVIDWLAEEADLSVHVSTMPPGSLTYSDENEYTPDQAIERINRFLIPVGYTLIRSGKMISVIGLEDGRRDQLLDALAEYADLSDLDRRGDHEVVKCVFTLAKADPNIALAEVAGLIKLSKPLLLPKSKQILVTDTAARLRMVRNVLEALENPSAGSGPVRRFQLKHVLASEVFATVRPLIGIDDESSNVGPDVSLATGADSREIFATGSAEKLSIIEDVVEMLDKSRADQDASTAPALRAHPTNGADLQTVDDVLQTLLAGENVRLAQDQSAGRLIVLASNDIHRLIEKTITELEGEAPVFEAFRLKRVEPYVALSVIREMFDIPFFSDEEGEEDHPRLDWDTPSRRLFVRGKRTQVEEIRKIIEELEQPRESTKGPLRVLPLHGERAQRLLETGKRFWPGNADVLVFPPDTAERPADVLERVIDGGKPVASPPANREPRSRSQTQTQTQTSKAADNARTSRPWGTLLVDFPAASDEPTNDTAFQAPPAEDRTAGVIKAQVTPRGILMHSEDIESLNRFVEHLRAIAAPGELSDKKMVIFYLTHLPAEHAKALLTDLRRSQSFGRDRSLDEPGAEDDAPSTRRSYYSFSGPSIIADPRLNRLIVQGTVDEILEIEKHLKIIDRERSLADVQTQGKPHVIELVHIRAADAAAVIRDAYPGRFTNGAARGQNAQQQQAQLQQQLKFSQAQLQIQQQQQQQQLAQQSQGQSAPRDGRSPASRGPQTQQPTGQEPNGRNTQRPQESERRTAVGGQQSRTQEPRMTLSVEESSNSLIIRAPEQLFEEVAELVQLIDQKATRTTEVINFHGASTNYVKQILQGITAQQSAASQAPQPTTAPKPAPPPVPQLGQPQPSR